MPLAVLRYIFNNKYLIFITIIIMSYMSFFLYYTYSKFRIESLIVKTQKLEHDVAQKETYIKTLKIDYDKIIQSKEQLANLNTQYTKNINQLRDKLNRESSGKTSINDLVKNKPGLIERYINKEVKRQIECFKTISADGDC